MQEDQTPLQFAARVLETLPAVYGRFAGLAARTRRHDHRFCRCVCGVSGKKFALATLKPTSHGDKLRPFPEEMNRRLISPLAELNFAPTVRAAAQSSRRGISDSRIILTGNTVVDALNGILARAVKFSICGSRSLGQNSSC